MSKVRLNGFDDKILSIYANNGIDQHFFMYTESEYNNGPAVVGTYGPDGGFIKLSEEEFDEILTVFQYWKENYFNG